MGAMAVAVSELVAAVAAVAIESRAAVAVAMRAVMVATQRREAVERRGRRPWAALAPQRRR